MIKSDRKTLRIGDCVWVKSPGRPSEFDHGEVYEIWEDDERGTSFSFYSDINGGLSISVIDNIKDKAAPRMETKLLKVRKEVLEVLKSK